MRTPSILLKVCEKLERSLTERLSLCLSRRRDRVGVGNEKQRWLPIMLAGLIVPAPGWAATATAEWPENYFNPRPLEGDILLPMPCGGAMAFRKVHTQASGPLGDQRVEIGDSDDARGFSEHTRTTHLAGGFIDSPRSRYFLMGKYEVDNLQYQALTAPECPDPKPRLRLPRTEVTWHEAVAFADRYSVWLHAKAATTPDCNGKTTLCIPREDGKPGFVRLPTEVEWEFAARGGIRVSPSDFREGVFPMPEGLGNYAWFAGSGSANGKAQVIGVKQPNPLGLHDMLGNVAEIVLEPFRLNRLDRLHGQAGGFIVRGGDFLTPAEDIRTALRHEIPFYDAQGPVRSRATGFRLMVAVPVITSQERLREIQQAWDRLGTVAASPPEDPEPASPPPPPGMDPTPLADPIDELSTIAEAADDPNMRKRLHRLRSVMRANVQALNDQRDRAARETLRLGGVLCQKLKDDDRVIRSIRRQMETCVKNQGASFPRCKRYQENLEANARIVQYNLGVYADAVLATARNYSAPVLDGQRALLVEEIGRKPFTALIPFIERFHDQAVAYGRDWQVKRDQWNKECAAT